MKTPATPKLAFELWKNLVAAWNALRDPQVALWKKAIPALCVAYLIWPLDLIADPILGLGQIDDLALIIAGLQLFVHLAQTDAPQQVSTHQEKDTSQGVETIDANYRIVD